MAVVMRWHGFRRFFRLALRLRSCSAPVLWRFRMMGGGGMRQVSEGRAHHPQRKRRGSGALQERRRFGRTLRLR